MGGLGRAGGLGAVAGRGLEGREARGEGDVQEGDGGEGEQAVVRLDEEVCEHLPAGRTVHLGVRLGARVGPV